jgi:hypothetical protein
MCKIYGSHGSEDEKFYVLGCHVMSLVITDASEELIASMIRVESIRELGTNLALTAK